MEWSIRPVKAPPGVDAESAAWVLTGSRPSSMAVPLGALEAVAPGLVSRSSPAAEVEAAKQAKYAQLGNILEYPGEPNALDSAGRSSMHGAQPMVYVMDSHPALVNESKNDIIEIGDRHLAALAKIPKGERAGAAALAIRARFYKEIKEMREEFDFNLWDALAEIVGAPRVPVEDDTVDYSAARAGNAAAATEAAELGVEDGVAVVGTVLA